MKSKSVKILVAVALVVTTMIVIFYSCKDDKSIDTSNLEVDEAVHVSSNDINSFLAKYPKLNQYKSQLNKLYESQNSETIWYNENEEVQELAGVLRYNLQNISTEGIKEKTPYLLEFNDIFTNEVDSPNSIKSNDILISGLYLYYNDKVYEGSVNSRKLGWYIDKNKIDYIHLIDTIKANPNVDIKKIAIIDQYYKLHEKLIYYTNIEKKGGWNKVEFKSDNLPIHLGDTSSVVIAVKKRLIKEDFLNDDNTSNVFNIGLQAAINKYQQVNSITTNDTIINKELLVSLNKPVSEKIKTLKVNMERCRWVNPKLLNSEELIFVNIPSFELDYIKNNTSAFKTKVVVGKNASKTVIFNDEMSYIVFAPYWNVPKSIINSEIIPGMDKDENYLEKHKMEWNDGNVRQIPGPWNSLGLVKFIFPNSNNIYLHDTPSKNLFKKDERAFSHGCIRVKDPDILAEKILSNDPNWNREKIYEAMNSSKEKAYKLQNKIPVVISYFTAWVNDNGELRFYDDVYNRDNRLAKIIL